MENSIFWISFITILSGLILKIVAYIFKSKCSKCTMCCISVERDVLVEEKEQEFIINHQNQNNNQNQNQNNNNNNSMDPL